MSFLGEGLNPVVEYPEAHNMFKINSNKDIYRDVV